MHFNIIKRTLEQVKFFQKCLDVSFKKGIDVGGVENPNSSFREAAKIDEVSPYFIVKQYANKHIMAFQNAVKPTEIKTESEPLVERLVDITNYMSLLQTLLAEDESPLALQTQQESSVQLAVGFVSGFNVEFLPIRFGKGQIQFAFRDTKEQGKKFAIVITPNIKLKASTVILEVNFETGLVTNFENNTEL